MPAASDPAALDRLKARIEALCAKTVANGCTEDEALAAAAKVAELLDRYELSLDEVAVRATRCIETAYQSPHKKRVPLGECLGAVAAFCRCRVWREGRDRHVFFGLGSDVAAAVALAGVIDGAIRHALGRYKTSREYADFRHSERPLANSSFALGMAAAIADKLAAMTAAREATGRGSGRDVVALKNSIVDSELAKLGVSLRTVDDGGPRRLVFPDAFDAGGETGAAFDPQATRIGKREKRSH